MVQVTRSHVPGWFDGVCLLGTILHVQKTGRENTIKGIDRCTTRCAVVQF